MEISKQMHLPLKMAYNRQDAIVNSFEVEVAQCRSIDYVGPIVKAVNNYDRMIDLLVRNLAAWEDEEESVKEEHEELITELRNFLDGV